MSVLIGVVPLLLLLIPLAIAVRVLYFLTLQRALERCSPENRTMTPGLVWLLFVPLFSLVWTFFVVLALGKSLGNEYRSRGMPAPSRPGQTLGLTMAVVEAISAVLGEAVYWRDLASIISSGASRGLAHPWHLGGTAVELMVALSIAGLVLWIIYWEEIHGFSKRLVVPQYPAGPPVGPYGGYGAPGVYCWQCGLWFQGGAFCPRCGAKQRPA